MSRAYFTEDAKMYTPRNHTPWSLEECETITKTLEDKSYNCTCVNRVGCDRKYHDALLVNREDMPRLIEQLFRQRIVVEVQAEGHGKAAINFVYDYPAKEIITAVSRFQKNKEVEL